MKFAAITGGRLHLADRGELPRRRGRPDLLRRRAAKTRLGYDDALDAFGVHGIGGATGGAGHRPAHRAALDGGHSGGLDLLSKQAIGFAAAGHGRRRHLRAAQGIDLVIGLRVDAETEHDGLDGALHGESAYASPGSVAHGS